MAKEAYFFSHDSNARSDPKISQMRSVYKGEGYGWYWILIEMLREQENFELSMQGKYVWNAFALQFDTTAEKAEAFVRDCICEFKLFESDDKTFWSNSLKKRMKLKEEKSEKARNSAKARWNKASDTNDSMRTHANDNANASKNDAIKEKKEKEKKENNIYTSGSNEYRLTEYLYQQILNNNENAKPPNYQTWCKQFNLILNRDKRNFEEVMQVIEFCQNDNFWYKNILSPGKLRDKYDRLTLQMNENKKKYSYKHQEDLGPL